MTDLAAITRSVLDLGDYQLRTIDYDTQLIGPVTDSIIDADRLVREGWGNGMPNFALYRAALAGDALYVAPLRRWCVAFSVAYCEAGGVRKDAYSDELACVAAWDALHLVMHCRELAPYTELAADLGVHKNTYRRLRDFLYRLWSASLRDYWAELGIAIRRVRGRERSAPSVNPIGRWSDGRGFADEIDTARQGTWRALPKLSH